MQKIISKWCVIKQSLAILDCFFVKCLSFNFSTQQIGEVSSRHRRVLLGFIEAVRLLFLLFVLFYFSFYCVDYFSFAPLSSKLMYKHASI